MASIITASRAARRAFADPAAHRSADEEAAERLLAPADEIAAAPDALHQRWQVETVNSMLKRLLGSALRARSYWSQCREILLRAITLNIMILRQRKGFYRAGQALIFN